MRKRGLASVLLIAGASGAIATALGPNGFNLFARAIDAYRYQVASPGERVMIEAGRRIMAVPGLKERVAGLPPAQLQAEIRRMTTNGLNRLSDAELDARLAANQRLFEAADDAFLHAVYMGSAAPADFQRAIAAAGDDAVRGYMAYAERAVIAEVEGRPIAYVSAADEEAAWEAFRTDLGPAELARFDKAIAAKAPSVPEAAWLLRELYRVAQTLAPPHRAHMARILTMNRPPGR